MQKIDRSVLCFLSKQIRIGAYIICFTISICNCKMYQLVCFSRILKYENPCPCPRPHYISRTMILNGFGEKWPISRIIHFCLKLVCFNIVLYRTCIGSFDSCFMNLCGNTSRHHWIRNIHIYCKWVPISNMLHIHLELSYIRDNCRKNESLYGVLACFQNHAGLNIFNGLIVINSSMLFNGVEIGSENKTVGGILFLKSITKGQQNKKTKSHPMHFQIFILLQMHGIADNICFASAKIFMQLVIWSTSKYASIELNIGILSQNEGASHRKCLKFKLHAFGPQLGIWSFQFNESIGKG